MLWHKMQIESEKLFSTEQSNKLSLCSYFASFMAAPLTATEKPTKVFIEIVVFLGGKRKKLSKKILHGWPYILQVAVDDAYW